MERPLAADVLVFDLRDEEIRAEGAEGRGSRQARTLIKAGPLRVTLVTLAAGGQIAEHHADGPITVHVLSGSIRFTASGTDYDLGVGQLLMAGPGVRHGVSSSAGGSFLLTVAQPAAAAPQVSP
jgi:quercetin dioxygenase-like cupin family protein